jgi:hypothetical protein
MSRRGRGNLTDPTADRATDPPRKPDAVDLEPLTDYLVRAALDRAAEPAPARTPPTSPLAREALRCALHELEQRGIDAVDACRLLARATGIDPAAVLQTRTDRKKNRV